MSKKYHHGDLENALLTAAEQLLEEKGIAGISLREVAKQAGVSHTAPYRHFTDKQALLQALAVIGYRRLAEAMEKAIEQHPDDPLAQLRASLSAYIDLAAQQPQIDQLMFGGIFLDVSAMSEDYIRESGRAFEGLLQIIRNGQEKGLYREDDTLNLALAAWSQAHGLASLMNSGQLGPLNEDERQGLIAHMGTILYSGMKQP